MRCNNVARPSLLCVGVKRRPVRVERDERGVGPIAFPDKGKALEGPCSFRRSYWAKLRGRRRKRTTCALLDNASVKCWGNNYSGQLGQGVNTDRIGAWSNLIW